MKLDDEMDMQNLKSTERPESFNFRHEKLNFYNYMYYTCNILQ